MMVAHIMGIPAEETLLQLAPAGAAMLTALAVAGHVRIERLIGRRWRR
jgi:nucleotide-binding universal stress UspA family protein